MEKFIKEHLAVLVSLVICAILWFLPTGFEDTIIYKDKVRCTAIVLKVDNSNLVKVGKVATGDQSATLEIRDGTWKGHKIEGYNLLTGSLEKDNIYAVGDKVFVLVTLREGKPNAATMIDYARRNIQSILLIIFAIFLIMVAGKTGIRAILSFAITVLAIWKLLVPLYLRGFQPILIGAVITIFLTAVIISLVFGFDRKMLSATAGSVFGTLVTLGVGMIFTDLFKIQGMVMQNAESLLYGGYVNLNLTQIFVASIFIGSSGAMMDLAVDITSAVQEVVDKKPDISTVEAIKSGMNVGRAAMGTMTTTLLLAYSGGYVSLLMVFMAQGTPIDNILNYKYVAAEFLDTIVGSFGLVSVAPLTAICAGYLLTQKSNV